MPSFPDLARVIAEHRQYFEAYLPPKTIWEARLEEVTAIRHRVAHFRTIHRDDVARLRQFLRDIDRGFWRFCTGYNDRHSVVPQTNDPVVLHFMPLDPFPLTEVGDKQWSRVGVADPTAPLAVTVEVLLMPWAQWSTPIAGKQGFLYDVSIHARQSRVLDYRLILRETKSLQAGLAHLCLDRMSTTLRLTIPSCLGESAVETMIQSFYDAALFAARPGCAGMSEARRCGCVPPSAR